MSEAEDDNSSINSGATAASQKRKKRSNIGSSQHNKRYRYNASPDDLIDQPEEDEDDNVHLEAMGSPPMPEEEQYEEEMKTESKTPRPTNRRKKYKTKLADVQEYVKRYWQQQEERKKKYEEELKTRSERATEHKHDDVEEKENQ